MAALNAAQKKKIRAQARSGTLSHAWLLLGGTREAREDLAAFLAAALVCTGQEAPCGVCPHCVKLAKGIHPDLIRLEKLPDKSGYVVEQVRDLVRDAYVMPNEAPRKVYYIPAADEMNLNAQNAMLKLLEDPPARSVFILAAANAAAMLDTVRSRCTELYAEGGDGAGDENKYARALFDSFLRRSAWDVAAAATLMEKAKLDREEFDGALEALSRLFARRLLAEKDPQRRKELFAAMDKTEELLRRREANNTAAGHTAGALAVALGRIMAGD